jgi:putative endonuclease
MDRQYCVYIITNKYHTTLYTGVTNDLQRRIYEHKAKLVKGFSKEYDLFKLVYYEITGDVKAAIEREKQIKAGSRRNKIDLINQMNPEWKDLYTEFI